MAVKKSKAEMEAKGPDTWVDVYPPSRLAGNLRQEELLGPLQALIKHGYVFSNGQRTITGVLGFPKDVRISDRYPGFQVLVQWMTSVPAGRTAYDMAFAEKLRIIWFGTSGKKEGLRIMGLEAWPLSLWEEEA